MKLNRKSLGNLLIVLSLGLVLFIYYPLIPLYLFPPKATAIVKDGKTVIEIPKIHAVAPILENTDPWNEPEYQKALKLGVAHAKGTSLPGEPGTTFLFAHSSDNPFNLVRSNLSFLRLGELTQGDQIKITRQNHTYIYKVTDKKTVWPNEVNYLLDTKKTQLILQTCTPLGTSLKRLLVFATPIS